MKRIRKETERIKNIRNIEDKIVDRESITGFEISTVDWEKKLKEQRRTIEEESEKTIN